jgi:adenosine deaminase
MRVEALKQAQKDGASEYGVETQWIMNFQRDHPADEGLDLLDRAEPYRDFIVGVGLDNTEINGFPDLFREVFQKARSKEYRLTSHCDVNQPNTNAHIRGCLEILDVDRIDHGLNVADDDTLLDIVLSREIGLTACPTYYVSQSACPPDRLAMIEKLFDAGALISINSDDPAQFGSGWLTQVLASAQTAGQFSRSDMIKFIENGFRSSWLDSTRKNSYLDKLAQYQKKASAQMKV